MDHRLTDTSDMEVVNHMTNAALCCLKNVKGHRLSMSEIRYIIYALNIIVLKKVPISTGCYVVSFI